MLYYKHGTGMTMCGLEAKIGRNIEHEKDDDGNMTEALRRAFELAQQRPEEEQEMIAQLILEELGAEERWNQLLAHPKSAILLEQMAEQARREHTGGFTRNLDELL